jgi:6-pyruvoyltetrahydropterin/6-carboxytetrahydropterin synthase
VYRIAKRFTFSAAHSLPALPPEHKCHRPHGHNYVVELILEAASLSYVNGMVFDYGALDPFKQWIDVTLDHRDLNPWMEGRCTPLSHEGERQTTAENMARELFNVAVDLLQIDAFLVAVRVKETDNTWAEYSQPYLLNQQG